MIGGPCFAAAAPPGPEGTPPSAPAPTTLLMGSTDRPMRSQTHTGWGSQPTRSTSRWRQRLRCPKGASRRKRRGSSAQLRPRSDPDQPCPPTPPPYIGSCWAGDRALSMPRHAIRSHGLHLPPLPHRPRDPHLPHARPKARRTLRQRSPTCHHTAEPSHRRTHSPRQTQQPKRTERQRR